MLYIQKYYFTERGRAQEKLSWLVWMGFLSQTKLSICAITHWCVLPILEVDAMHSDATFKPSI
jgi:hypothetical protein